MNAEQVIAKGSTSFAAAARLFDAPTRHSVVHLYAWCRHCDDVVDGQQLGFAQSAQPREASLDRVDALARDTLRAMRGQSFGDRHGLAAPFLGFAEVARRHRIPERFALEHLQGFRMDAQGRRYAGLADTLDYAWHVAGVVGVMMAMVMGRRDDATLDHAADLGLAFQLTNIARDIVDDHAAGRIYLPADWLAEQKLDAQTLALPQHRAALARVARRLVLCAEPYYASARRGLACLPWRSAWAVASAHGVYRAIGLNVVRRGARAWDERVSVAKPRKLALLCGGALRATTSRGSTAPVPWQRQGLWTRP
jgi:15-cis-phytoene synthase